MDVEAIRASLCPDLAAIAQEQPPDVGPAQIRTTHPRGWIALAHGGLGQRAELASRAHIPAQMPAHRTRGSAFLGRVPNLNELQMKRLIGSLGQVQGRSLRELLQLPLAQARQCQCAQERRGRTPRRKQVLPPETPRPNRKIMRTVAKIPTFPAKSRSKYIASRLTWRFGRRGTSSKSLRPHPILTCSYS